MPSKCLAEPIQPVASLTQKSILEEVNRILATKRLLEIEKVKFIGKTARESRDRFRLHMKGIANHLEFDFTRLASDRIIEFDPDINPGLRLAIENSLDFLCEFLRERGYLYELGDWDKIPEK